MTAGAGAPRTIEAATDADLDAILAISAASFPRPWPPHLYVEELRRAHARVEVARAGGVIVGYLITWHVLDEVHLLEIAVAPHARRQGVGEALMAHLCTRADAPVDDGGARLVTLEVRAGNAAARALYARWGFAVVATRRGYYEDGEDGVVMLRARR